jgi:hypothetical protein
MKVLDIERNHGLFLDYVKNLGCLTDGFEYNHFSRQMAMERGHKMISDIQEVDENYDFVT